MIATQRSILKGKWDGRILTIGSTSIDFKGKNRTVNFLNYMISCNEATPADISKHLYGVEIDRCSEILRTSVKSNTNKMISRTRKILTNRFGYKWLVRHQGRFIFLCDYQLEISPSESKSRPCKQFRSKSPACMPLARV